MWQRIISSVQDHGLDLFNILEMTISGQQRPADLHTAGCNPDIVDRNFGSFINQEQINDSILSWDILIDIDYFGLQFFDDFPQFSFIEFRP